MAGSWGSVLTALTALSVAASGLLGGLHKSPPPWAAWLRVVMGSALIVLGVYRWLARHRHTDSPSWMRSFAAIAPGRAGVTGCVLAAARPDVSLLCVSAGLAIGTSGLGLIGDWIAAAFFVVVAASTVAIPVLAYAAAGRRLDGTLARLKTWMDENNAALLAVVLVVIGAMVPHNGIQEL